MLLDSKGQIFAGNKMDFGDLIDGDFTLFTCWLLIFLLFLQVKSLFSTGLYPSTCISPAAIARRHHRSNMGTACTAQKGTVGA